MRNRSPANGSSAKPAHPTGLLPQSQVVVHTDLLALGKIPDPFVADNEKTMWVAEQDWAYRHTFQADGAVMGEDKVFLIADGLDTLATVTLNGQVLGDTDNMFRRYEWEVKTPLRPGNELLIQFRSPVPFALLKTPSAHSRASPRPSRAARTCARHHASLAGTGALAPPIGVWRDIRLEGRSVARLEDVHLRQRHAGGSGRLWLPWPSNPGDAPLSIQFVRRRPAVPNSRPPNQSVARLPPWLWPSPTRSSGGPTATARSLCIKLTLSSTPATGS